MSDRWKEEEAGAREKLLEGSSGKEEQDEEEIGRKRERDEAGKPQEK